MLEDVVDVLACPHCGERLKLTGRCLSCPEHHVFDIARQGYVSLLSGRNRISGDTSAMVSARANFLNAGHFLPIVEQVAEAVPTGAGRVLDFGAGTGHYLAEVLSRCPDRTGLAMDVSKHACRRAAKAHSRIGAVVADAWRGLPVRSGMVSVVLNVFAPRNATEMHRVLEPGGYLVVVTPNAAHLGELVSALELLTVDERKQQRLDTQLGELFEPVGQQHVEFSMSLRPADVAAVVAMGPSAWHASEDALEGQVAGLPDPIDVTASVTVSVHQRAPVTSPPRSLEE